MVGGVWCSRTRARVAIAYVQLSIFNIRSLFNYLIRYPKLSSEASVPFLRDMDLDVAAVDAPKQAKGDVSTGAQVARAHGSACDFDSALTRLHQSGMLSSLSLFIGVIAGLVGVGGGEFLVPMFLSIGFSHQKSATTSSCLIMLAMLSDAVNYLRSGELQVSEFLLTFDSLIVMPHRTSRPCRLPHSLAAFPPVRPLAVRLAPLGRSPRQASGRASPPYLRPSPPYAAAQISKHMTSPARQAWLLMSLFVAICICCLLACVQAAESASKVQGSVLSVQTSLFC